MLVETTPKRKASDGDIDTKHTKKSKKNNHAKRTAIYAVLMRNGDVNDFKKLKDKNEFVEENKEIVLETKDFRTTKDFKEWKKMKEAIPVSPKNAKKEEGENGLIKMSPDDAKKVHKCVSMVNDLKPADGIYVYWKTTSTSSAAGVVIRFLDKTGADAWTIKPNFLSHALTAYVSMFKQEYAHVQNALTNVMSGFMRDPSGDSNKAKTKLWESPKTKKKREFELYVLNSWFPLKSIKELPTREDETNYIKSACVDIGTALAGIMQTEAFAECYKAAIGNDNIWRAINSDYGNYVGFVKHAKIKVEECSNFNQHLVMNDASDLVGILYDNGGKTKKYPDEDETAEDTPEELAEEDDEDEDDSEDDDDDGGDKEDDEEEKIDVEQEEGEHDEEQEEDEFKDACDEQKQDDGVKTRRRTKNNA